MTDEHVHQNPFWRLPGKDPANVLFDRAASVTLNFMGGSSTHQHDLALSPLYSDGRKLLLDDITHLSVALRVKFMATDEFDLQSIEFIPVTASSKDASKDYSATFTIVRITVIVHDGLIQQRFREIYDAASAKNES
jgi:hypothetical protein